MEFQQLARQAAGQILGASQRAELVSAAAAHKRGLFGRGEPSGSDEEGNENELDEADDDELLDYQLDVAAAAGGLFQKEGRANKTADQQQRQQQQQLDSNGYLVDKNKKLFPQKLWELIHNPSIQHCLRWSQDGQRVYLNRSEFETYYLKTANNQFHTQKAISFVRQMNMYGFRKVDDCYYENDNFRRDRQYLLKNMIRRHPNKGLFVGLVEQHQLAASAAAAQQAVALQQAASLQQQFEQKSRAAEQALRLNSFLSSHQFHAAAAAAAAAAQHNQLLNNKNQQRQPVGAGSKQHSAPHHLNQKQQHQQQHHHHKQLCDSLNETNAALLKNLALAHQHQQQQQQQLVNCQQEPPASHQVQPKKSRLLSDFYAAAAAAAAGTQAAPANPLQQADRQQQDSLHSGSSANSQLSRCSSIVNSSQASSVSPQPADSPPTARAPLGGGGGCGGAQLAKLREPVDFRAGGNGQSLSAARQQAALHETLVRSLLQLKQQQQQQQPVEQLLASLQRHGAAQQQSRNLLESLASLSSASATGSESPPLLAAAAAAAPATERHCDENTALDLAKSLPVNLIKFDDDDGGESVRDEDDDEDSRSGDEIDVGVEGRNAIAAAAAEHAGGQVVDGVDSPLEGAKKVRKFLEDHCAGADDEAELDTISVKQESSESTGYISGESSPKRRKRQRLCSAADEDGAPLSQADQLSPSKLAKLLVSKVCLCKGAAEPLALNEAALNEASRYIECFLEILLQDAALISSHSQIAKLRPEQDDQQDEEPETCAKRHEGGGACKIDASCLSLALKLMPSKLLAGIQANGNRLQQVKSERLGAGAAGARPS